jgi:hypothetical protein
MRQVQGSEYAQSDNGKADRKETIRKSKEKPRAKMREAIKEELRGYIERGDESELRAYIEVTTEQIEETVLEFLSTEKLKGPGLEGLRFEV